jgi:beta-galactosidase
MRMKWLVVLLIVAQGAVAQRRMEPFDNGWKFLQADALGAEAVGFADGGWKMVDVPHDWAIAGPFLATNPSGGAGGFAPAGVGWYRKHFVLPKEEANKRVYIEFDGVMANCDVWVNGELLGHRANGYVSFGYELTGKVKFGGLDNVIAVRVDDSQQPSSRWYEGAGIYRHVRLVVTGMVHMVPWGMVVTTPSVTKDSATVHVRSTVVNETDTAAKMHMNLEFITPSGKPILTYVPITSKEVTVGPRQTAELDAEYKMAHPEMWNLDHPTLYSVRATLQPYQQPPSDEKSVGFGIREFHFDPNTGFWLNGKSVKILGVALHGDVGALGVAAPMGAWEHRLAAMKAMGANAIRTAHNPPSPQFLDLCDRMGFLVMDEMFDQWTVAKTPYDYHLYFKEHYLDDVRDTVMRDRNHPSVILWSAGNEIHDTPKAELAKSILEPMVAAFHKYDPTRPVTQALFRPNVSHDYDDGLADMLDVVGQNYRPAEILAAHAQKSSRKIIGTENTHGLDQWLPVRDHAEYSGEFIWAGVDYLGEARGWPFIGSGGGLDDRTDAMKPDGLERESWWSRKPVVHIVRRVAAEMAASTDPGYEAGSPQALALAGGAAGGAKATQTTATAEGTAPTIPPGVARRDHGAPPALVPAPRAEEFGRATVFADWTPRSLAAHEENVEVYSNCSSVQLWLNGSSLGAKARSADDSARKWTVAFAPGELKASCADGTAETLRTAGAAAKVTLTVERGKLGPGFDDVGYVRARVVDKDGTVVPDAATVLHFSVSGNGVILATDSGDNAYRSPFQSADRMAFHGGAIAIVRGTGDVMAKVSAEGLAGSSVVLHGQ